LNGIPSLTSRKDEAEAERFLNKVDDVTGLLQMLLSKDQSEVVTQNRHVPRSNQKRVEQKSAKQKRDYTVKKVHEFPVSSRDVTNQTPPGQE
jgi:hypothetical protein